MDDGTLLAQLRTALPDSLSVEGDPRYEVGRRLWNAAIDRRPAAIVHCTSADAAALALKLATERGVSVSIKGGGHNVAGRAVRDGALLLDLSALNGVVVKPEERIAIVQGGALWRDVDAATAAHDLATVGGLVSSTGVGGFTLGGGAGWLMRQHGLASDNVLGLTIALPDGRREHVSASEHPELFWGLRGGGGLALVTEFEFRLHPLRNVMAGIVIHRAEDAANVMREFAHFARSAPDEFCGLVALAHAPPIPFLAPDWHGRPVAIQAVCWSGDLREGPGALRPLLSFGAPLAVHVATMPYWQWQRAQDAGAPAGRCHYWKSANLDVLDGQTIDALAGMVMTLPTPFTEIHVQHLGGAVARSPSGDTAFAHRDANFFVNFIGTSDTVADLPRVTAAIRAFHERIAAGSLERSMPNFDGTDEVTTSRHFDGQRLQRLEALRAQVAASAL